jgi:CMP/dCMP kinase
MTPRSDGIVVAIDGPAASGKSSTAKAVAANLDYRHLDSGAFYRAITLSALERGMPPDRWHELSASDLADLHIAARPVAGGFAITRDGVDLGDAIRSAEVTAHVSSMAALPAVRHWFLDILRRTAHDGGLVADGRDIGTVVFPDAELKIFLVCDPEERAMRRLRQNGVQSPTPEQIRDEARRLLERDQSDQSRDVAPLLRAPDAVLLDTTGLDFDAQVRAIARLARAAAAG